MVASAGGYWSLEFISTCDACEFAQVAFGLRKWLGEAVRTLLFIRRINSWSDLNLRLLLGFSIQVHTLIHSLVLSHKESLAAPLLSLWGAALGAGSTRHGARPPPSRGARLPALLGVACGCPSQSCARCLPATSHNRCRRPVAYKRHRCCCLRWTPQADEPPFFQLARRCYAKSVCCTRMFQVFQIYVTSVSYECCTSRSTCCICYRGYTHML
jgi:hypothetical protein